MNILVLSNAFWLGHTEGITKSLLPEVEKLAVRDFNNFHIGLDLYHVTLMIIELLFIIIIINMGID